MGRAGDRFADMKQLVQVKREIVRKAGGTPGVGERPRGAGRGTGGGGPVERRVPHARVRRRAWGWLV
jgi:hypothetical protein